MGAYIRLAVSGDIESMLDIYSYYVTETTATFEYEVPTVEEFIRRFESISKDFPWLVCEADGHAAGYAYAHKAFERAAYQWDCALTVYIAEEYQRRGIASALYKSIIDAVGLQGYYNLYCIITGANIKSLEFHHEMGFEDFAVFKNTGYKHGNWLDTVWMGKTLRAFDSEPVPPRSFSEIDMGDFNDIHKKYEGLIK